jgi:tRNA A-37 threonylcarbamoyl transferase component Bud32
MTRAGQLEPPGRLLASGRAADVYDLGDGRVLRRYKTPHSCLHEAAVMQHVRAHGYPVPAVYEVRGGDMVMERLDGPTMLEDLGRHPGRVLRHASTLGELIERLHAIPPAPWMETRMEGDAIVHLDLHPLNVLLTSRGAMVIDWTNAGRGDGAIDLADLWLLTLSATPPGRLERVVASFGRKIFLNRVLKRFDLDPVRRLLPDAFERRARDRNMSEREIERMRRVVTHHGRPD